MLTQPKLFDDGIEDISLTKREELEMLLAREGCDRPWNLTLDQLLDDIEMIFGE